MSLDKAIKDLKYDKRLLELNLRLGMLTQAEYDQHVGALQDEEVNSEKIDIESQANASEPS